MDNDKLASQFEKLHELKSLGLVQLRALHGNTFTGTKWAVFIPQWMHRSLMEKRIWYRWCVSHYHLPKDHPRAIAFRAKTRVILAQQFVEGYATKEQVHRQQLMEHRRFTKEGIEAMPMEEVDGFLSAIGLFITGTRAQRRKCLWEYFHLPLSKLPVKRRRSSVPTVVNTVVGLVRDHPNMGYDEFRARFGRILPTVCRQIFYNARYKLRKQGWPLPRHKAGRKQIKPPEAPPMDENTD